MSWVKSLLFGDAKSSPPEAAKPPVAPSTERTANESPTQSAPAPAAATVPITPILTTGGTSVAKVEKDEFDESDEDESLLSTKPRPATIPTPAAPSTTIPQQSPINEKPAPTFGFPTGAGLIMEPPVTESAVVSATIVRPTVTPIIARPTVDPPLAFLAHDLVDDTVKDRGARWIRRLCNLQQRATAEQLSSEQIKILYEREVADEQSENARSPREIGPLARSPREIEPLAQNTEMMRTTVAPTVTPIISRPTVDAPQPTVEPAAAPFPIEALTAVATSIENSIKKSIGISETGNSAEISEMTADTEAKRQVKDGFDLLSAALARAAQQPVRPNEFGCIMSYVVSFLARQHTRPNIVVPGIRYITEQVQKLVDSRALPNHLPKSNPLTDSNNHQEASDTKTAQGPISLPRGDLAQATENATVPTPAPSPAPAVSTAELANSGAVAWGEIQAKDRQAAIKEGWKFLSAALVHLEQRPVEPNEFGRMMHYVVGYLDAQQLLYSTVIMPSMDDINKQVKSLADYRAAHLPEMNLINEQVKNPFTGAKDALSVAIVADEKKKKEKTNLSIDEFVAKFGGDAAPAADATSSGTPPIAATDQSSENPTRKASAALTIAELSELDAKKRGTINWQISPADDVEAKHRTAVRAELNSLSAAMVSLARIPVKPHNFDALICHIVNYLGHQSSIVLRELRFLTGSYEHITRSALAATPAALKAPVETAAAPPSALSVDGPTLLRDIEKLLKDQSRVETTREILAGKAPAAETALTPALPKAPSAPSASLAPLALPMVPKAGVGNGDDIWVMTFAERGIRVNLRQLYAKCLGLVDHREMMAQLCGQAAEVEFVNSILANCKSSDTIQIRASTFHEHAKTVKAEEQELLQKRAALTKRYKQLEDEIKSSSREMALWVKLQLQKLDVGAYVWVAHHYEPTDRSKIALHRYRVKSLVKQMNANRELPAGIVNLEPATVTSALPARASVGPDVYFVADYHSVLLVDNPEMKTICFLPSPVGDHIEQTLYTNLFSSTKLSFVL